MRFLFSLLFVVCIGLQPARGAESSSPQEEQFAQWMTYYYLEKDAANVSGYLQWLQDSRALETRPEALPPVAAFLSVIFSENPSRIMEWIRGRSLTGRTRDAIAAALWLSDNGSMVAELFPEVRRYSSGAPVLLSSMELTQASDLDMMWGAFSASGDDAYAKKLIDLLEADDSRLGGEAAAHTLRAASVWSISSNMKQHELIDRLVRREIGQHSGPIRKLLEAMASRAEKERTVLPNRNGEFSAMLILVREGELKEFEKPSNAALTLGEVKTAHRGDVLAAKLLFTGMQLAGDLTADVSFDLKILDPDGQIYDDADARDLPAVKRRVPNRFSVFDNGSFLKIGFESDDKLGTYRFVAEIRDNVGKLRIPLVAEVELVQ